MPWRSPTAALVGESQWESHHRHGEELLKKLDDLLRACICKAHDLAGVIVGTGPGSFTGLRIGLATAKTIAYSLDVPIVGVSTTQAWRSPRSTASGQHGIHRDPPGGSSRSLCAPRRRGR